MWGTVALMRQDGSLLTAGAQQVLILTDLADLAGTSEGTPLEGPLVAVDARGAREGLESICHLLGGLALDTGRVRRWMSSRGGFAVEGPTPWSPATFADPVRLTQTERARWCVEVGGDALSALHPRGTGDGGSPARCRIGTWPGCWRRLAGTWKNTWTNLSPSTF